MMDREEESIFLEEVSADEEVFSEDNSDIFSLGNDDWETESTSENEDDIKPFSAKRPRRIPSTSSSDSFAGEASQNDKHIWTTDKRDPPQFEFRGNPGLKIPNDVKSPGDFFDLFLTESFLNKIVQETNRYAAQQMAKFPVLRLSKPGNWKDTSADELRVFFGLLMHTGTISLPSVAHYWKTNKLYNFDFWKNRMPRNRFELILRFLHLNNNAEQDNDPLFKVNPISQHFNETMNRIYKPERKLCIQEAIVLWRGRLIFRKYIKNKRPRYGIKLYELCEPNGMVLKVKIYAGKYDHLSGRNHALNVVSALMDGFLNSGYELYMNNYYNSVRLAEKLTRKSTYVCGTLRFDRKGNPENLVKNKLNQGDSEWFRSGYLMVNKWKDKRDVLTISNMHKGVMVQVQNKKNGKISTKPDTVKDYTLGMAGIDHSHQHMSYYSFLRKTIPWYKRIILHYLETFLHNAHMLYNQRNQKNKRITLLQFRESVILHLLGEESNTRESGEGNTNATNFHYLEHLPPTGKKNMPTKPCRICTKEKIRKETRYFCPQCSEKPALCVDPCFRVYHIQKQ